MKYPEFKAGVYIQDGQLLFRVLRRESVGNGGPKEFRLVVENAQGGVYIQGYWVYPERKLEYEELGRFEVVPPIRALPAAA